MTDTEAPKEIPLNELDDEERLLEEARRERVAKEAFAETLSDNYKPSYLNTIDNGREYAKAVKAMCQHCMGYEEPVIRVRECTAFTCPLYSFRPYKKKMTRYVKVDGKYMKYDDLKPGQVPDEKQR